MLNLYNKRWLVVGWLFLLAVALVTVLLPRLALAQEGRIDLALNLVSNDYYNKVTAGKDNAFFLEVRNTGNVSITNIRLSADRPEGWTIEFKPGEISSLASGSVQTVDVKVIPAGNAGRGDYSVTLIAQANEIRKVQGVWFNVDRASYWLWVGAIIAAVVVAVFVFIFLRLGRQRN